MRVSGPPTSWWRVLAMLVIVSVLAAACGGDDDDANAADPDPTTAEDDEPTADPTEAPTTAPADDAEPTTDSDPAEDPGTELTASYRGVTEDTITVGILLLDKELLFETAGILLNWGDNEAQYQEAIDAVNDAGGVLGRMIEPIYVYVDPLSPTAYDEACVRLTQDEEIFAAIGFVRPAASALCYTEVGDIPFVGFLSDLTADVPERSILPIVTSNALPERIDIALVDLIVDAGELDGKTIAVLGNTDERNQLIADALAGHGYDVETMTVTSAPGFDEVADAAELDVIVQRWMADGIDYVIDTAGLDRPLAAANRAGFEADWATNRGTLLSLSRFDSGATEAEIARTIVVQEPSVELLLDLGHEPTVECVERWNANHPDEQAVLYPQEDDLDNLIRIARTCWQIGTFALIAELAGPDLTTESFAAAVGDVGSYEIALLPFASLRADKWDAGDVVTLYRWDPELQDYIAGELVDIG